MCESGLRTKNQTLRASFFMSGISNFFIFPISSIYLNTLHFTSLHFTFIRLSYTYDAVAESVYIPL